MKGINTAIIFSVLGIAALGLGMFLPLWSKHGIAVTAWEGGYLSFGRWVLLLGGLGSMAPIFVKSLRRTYWPAICALLILVQASLIIWKGYKLEAVGAGAVCLLLAGLLTAVAAAFHRRGP